ncbi:dihydrofolate reductase family protein [Rhizobium sp. TH2]|uniref:dihydrofolate reductase family protein n=1 Tax=Rhizobium sp. TH2 TaxID=2775403 RepID=UPI0021576E05|nr:dihydrofolate reductase family protein [Rhizobium sp. TH2]UVC07576.1 dihydrofolate reductase family protein [Rhizobium sp. TH2]
MAKLIAWNILSLDGFFEGEEKWDLELHNFAWGPELEKLSDEFGEKAAALVFGRVTYEGMRDYWTKSEPSTTTTYMNALPKLVASRTQKTSEWNNTVMTDDIEGEIARMRREDKKNSYIFGSAELTHSLMQAGLIDELMICYAPVAIGKGNPFFKGKVKVELIEAKGLAGGGVLVRYRPENVK